MKKNIQTTLIALLTLLPLGMQAQSVNFSKYEGSQIANSDFEDWSGPDFGNVPVGWHSFESVGGTNALIVGVAKSTEHTSKNSTGLHEGTLGEYCLKLVPRNLAIALANGTISTGRMNAGAYSATDPKNHAQMDISVTATSNGSPFYALLNQRPTALSVWVKFTQGTASSEHPYATVSAAITNGNYYQEPTANNDSSVVIGYAQNKEISSNGGVWQHLYVPFRYDSKNFNKTDNPKAIMVTFSTNADPGQGSSGDVLLIDDLELIYTLTVKIPKCGYYLFTNVPQINYTLDNYAVVMPEGLTGYALGITADGNPITTKTYKAGDVIPYGTSLLLEGKEGNYEFKTTLYEKGESPELNDYGKLVDGTELNDPIEGYQYYRLTSVSDKIPVLSIETNGARIKPGDALLRVKAELAAESYNHVLTESSVEGDVDGNGVVEATDVKALVDRLLGNELGMKGFLVPDADVNNDGRTTVADVTNLVNILMNE